MVAEQLNVLCNRDFDGYNTSRCSLVIIMSSMERVLPFF
jgi:hypothetical protein